jgi:SAM-dependent methyltransferase
MHRTRRRAVEIDVGTLMKSLTRSDLMAAAEDLPDASIDRVFCFDVFHHVVNPGQVIRELARILVDGGIAAFSEPGPCHSHTAESQREMRQHRVVENDVVIEDISADARAAGFRDIEFSLQTETSIRLGCEDFRALRERGPDASLTTRLLESVNSRNRSVTFFRLSEGGALPVDSRLRDGLVTRLTLDAVEPVVDSQGQPLLRVSLTVENVRDRLWRRSGSSRGSVNLGVHRLDAHGATLAHDHHRHLFLEADLPPGGTATTRVDLPVAPDAGSSVHELELVSEGVCWFAQNRSEPLRVGP